jgi:excisionase family DNA binding protein
MKIFTVPAAAKELKVSKDKVRAWIASGRLEASNVNERGMRPSYRISEGHLAAFMAKCSALPMIEPTPRKRLESVPFKRY